MIDNPYEELVRGVLEHGGDVVLEGPYICEGAAVLTLRLRGTKVAPMLDVLSARNPRDLLPYRTYWRDFALLLSCPLNSLGYP
jgi:hypothetical protein